MKIQNKYYRSRVINDADARTLVGIVLNSESGGGQLETLQSQLQELGNIVGRLLDTGAFTDEQLLEICDLQHNWEIVP